MNSREFLQLHVEVLLNGHPRARNGRVLKDGLRTLVVLCDSPLALGNNVYCKLSTSATSMQRKSEILRTLNRPVIASPCAATSCRRNHDNIRLRLLLDGYFTTDLKTEIENGKQRFTSEKTEGVAADPRLR